MVDARVARSRAAVVRAATDLLVEGGPSAVTIDAIVARSGVAKSTIYRHWASRDDVLLDVMESCAPVSPHPIRTSASRRRCAPSGTPSPRSSTIRSGRG